MNETDSDILSTKEAEVERATLETHLAFYTGTFHGAFSLCQESARMKAWLACRGFSIDEQKALSELLRKLSKAFYR